MMRPHQSVLVVGDSRSLLVEATDNVNGCGGVRAARWRQQAAIQKRAAEATAPWPQRLQQQQQPQETTTASKTKKNPLCGCFRENRALGEEDDDKNRERDPCHLQYYPCHLLFILAKRRAAAPAVHLGP